MKITIWRNREEKYTFFGLLMLVFTMLFSILFLNRDTYKADMDGDGIDETVKNIKFPVGRTLQTIYDDGIMYQTEYNTNGDVIHKWKIIPSENANEDDSPTILVWDIELKEEIPDQSAENSSDIAHNSPPGTSIT